MAFFKKPPETPSTEPMIAREKPSRHVPTAENEVSIIGPAMHIVGDLMTEGTVRIEGRIEGTVRAARAVVLGKDGEVVGDIVAQDVIIGGRVAGTVQAENRLELQSTAVIEGEIRARAQHLQLDEGARFNGSVRMLEDGAEPPMRALPAESMPAETEA